MDWDSEHSELRSRNYGPGVAGRGLAWQGVARRGLARLGVAGEARLGGAGRGWASRGRHKHQTGGLNMESKIKAGVQQVVRELYEKHGKVETTALIEAAKPKDSPAHAGFEWDNKIAGHQYRLWQARKWIRVITVIREEKEERLVHVPRIITENEALSTDEKESSEGHYQAVSVLIERPDEFEMALREAEMRLRSAKRSLDDLHNAAQRKGIPDRVAIIAQMAKAAELWAEALQSMH